MTISGNVTGITVDLARNVLLLHLDGSGTAIANPVSGERRGVLDVGANGWLLGVEVGEAYFAVADPAPGTEHLVRSCEALVSGIDDESMLVVPRRGDGYELSFPSGNQCWLRAPNGSGPAPLRLCSTLMSSR